MMHCVDVSRVVIMPLRQILILFIGLRRAKTVLEAQVNMAGHYDSLYVSPA